MPTSVPLHIVEADLGTHPTSVRPLNVVGGYGVLSPGHRWLAVMSSEGGQWNVFLEPFPPDGRRLKVSQGGAGEPLWRDAQTLVYRDGYRWYPVAVGSGPRPVGQATLYAEDEHFTDTWGRSHVMAANGDIIYLRGSVQAEGHFLRVMRGWTGQMIREVDAAAR